MKLKAYRKNDRGSAMAVCEVKKTIRNYRTFWVHDSGEPFQLVNRIHPADSVENAQAALDAYAAERGMTEARFLRPPDEYVTFGDEIIYRAEFSRPPSDPLTTLLGLLAASLRELLAGTTEKAGTSMKEGAAPTTETEEEPKEVEHD